MLSRHLVPNIIKQVVMLACLFLIIIIIQIVTFLSIYNKLYDNYKTRLKMLNAVEEHLTLGDMCNAISCTYVLSEKNDILYVNENGELKYSDHRLPDTKLIGYINTNLQTVVKYQNYRFYVDDKDILFKSIESIGAILIIGFIIALTLILLYYSLNSKYNKITYVNVRRSLELVAQRDVTEILHHEMNLPVAVLTDGINNIKSEITTLMNLRKDDPELLPIEENIQKELEDMLISIDSINGVLKLIGNNKTIKQTNGNLSILDVFDRAIINCNTFNLGNITYTVENREILCTNSVNYPLNNGELYNIFKVLINNSMEAKANGISIDATYDTKKNFLKIYLKDNGPGITDSNGKPLKNNNVIFEYGYSTKSSKIKNENLSKRFIYYIGWLFSIYVKDSYETGRGYGLYLNKKIIEEAKGSIYVGQSDKNGTLFVITIPIKKTKPHQHNM